MTELGGCIMCYIILLLGIFYFSLESHLLNILGYVVTFTVVHFHNIFEIQTIIN